MAFSTNDKQIRDVLRAGGVSCGNNSSSTVDKYKKIARSEGATDHASIMEKLTELFPKLLPNEEEVINPTPYVHETVPEPTQTDSIELHEQILDTKQTLQVKPVELAKQETRLENGKEVNRIKTERVVYFPDIEDRATRKFLSLEKPFVDALDVLAPTKEERNEWLNTVLMNDPDHAAAIVRNTIVSTLLTKWVQS